MAAGKAQLTSASLPSSLWNNDGDSRQKGQSDDVHNNHGFVNISGSSNGLLPTLHNAPAK